MAVIVVTRLRLADHAMLDDFFEAAVALLEQANASPGVIYTDVLAEANDVWWTCTSWQDRAAMQAFVGTDPHASTMDRLDEWCDEATFVDWEQDDATLPDWDTAFQRLVDEGQSSQLVHASSANAARSFPAPVVTS